MNQPIKFPDMRPAKRKDDIHIPPPSGFAQRIPLFPTTDAAAKNRRFERKRLLAWFGIAVALHAALLIGIWLLPALRIKWEPSPDAWVQVTSLPKEQSPAAVAAAGAATEATPVAKPGVLKSASAPKAPTPARDPGVPITLAP
jgi:hypothetical protein